MKCILITIGAAALAGGGAVLATNPPAGPPSELAGDWRCNETANAIDSSTQLSVGRGDATRAQFLINTPIGGAG